MNDNASGFNLLDDPWIPVLDSRGDQHTLSITGVIESAADLSEVTGEVATQAFAVTRLLLAFLHRALDGPRNVDQWETLWRRTDFPADPIAEYVVRVRPRFDLFDPTMPFFQVAGLRTEKGEVSGLEKIVADVPNGEPFFTVRSARNLTRIDAGEAARWLVHTHAFDPSGIKSGAVGDPTVKNGKGYPIGTGWSGWLGGVLPQGRNLRETLLLNLIAANATLCASLGASDDLPPWEREPDGAQCPPRVVSGTVALYTWQSRRIRLVGERAGVTGVVLANGDKLEPHNRHDVDPHTAWRYSDPQTRKAGRTVYMPRPHDPERAIWRGLNALLPSVAPRTGGSEPQRFLAPGVLQWIGTLVNNEAIADTYQPGIRTQGAEYGSQSATFAEIMDDLLPLSVILLRVDAPEAGMAATNAVADADEAAIALKMLADNIARAGGENPVTVRRRERLYAALDRPYRDWLAELGPDTDLNAARGRWQRLCRTVIERLATEVVTAAAPAAWVGRVVGGRLVTVGLAEAWFGAALRKALPLSFPVPPRSTKENNAA